MCGISGIYKFDKINDNDIVYLKKSVETLKKRGPDNQGFFNDNTVALGHSRLSVIDISDKANQPITSNDGRYTIVYNGEFYNYINERNNLLSKGYKFISQSDTEVLLYMYIEYGAGFIEKVNGCFAIAIYDKQNKSLFLARDRMGIKPLYIYNDTEKIIFASEIKALLEYGITREIDDTSIYNFFQFNYIPGPQTIFKNINKLTPGSYLIINTEKFIKNRYYSVPENAINKNLTYVDAQKKLINLIDNSVKSRLISDVSIGSFLSGGIDSSIITATASKFTKNLNTFSIGYADEPFFDETRYAELVARKFKTNHTTFKLTNADLFENVFNVLDTFDEPFADSSALVVYILSKLTKQKVTVALSGDGADEIFSGYNKHFAHYNANLSNLRNLIIKNTGFLWNTLPKSRNGKISNQIRKIQKYSKGLKLGDKERYWAWATIKNEKQAQDLLKFTIDTKDYGRRKREITEFITSGDFNKILFTDTHLVLQNDMLTKVDLMSMANSLEVRTPFLDHNIVNFAFSLSVNYKIDKSFKKKILQDAYRDILPRELYNRPKHGFEVPLLKWLKTDLQDIILQNLLNRDFIESQNIFNYNEIEKIINRLNSNNPQDAPAEVWALIVFQHWWKKYMY